jgi:hypothetical protein
MADAWQTLQSTVSLCPVIAFTAFRNRMLPYLHILWDLTHVALGEEDVI